VRWAGGFLLVLSLMARPALAQDGPTAAASEVKAAYLLNFTRYVEWPTRAFASPTSPIVICVVGPDPFGPALDDVVRTRWGEGTPVEGWRLGPPAPAAGCHVAFLAGGEAALARARESWRGRPTLLVGDGSGFAAKGGMIGFVEADETIRFEINAGAARGNGLQISSRVMTLATRVYGAGEGP
jgi:YfiR/HmsC-like